MKRLITITILTAGLVLGALYFGERPTSAQQRLFVPTCSGNATADTAALTALKTIIGTSQQATIQFPGKPTSASLCKLNTITFTANQTLDFTNGGIQGVDGQTVTIQGPRIIPTKQVFFNFTAGHGTISFSGSIASDGVKPEWWTTNTTPGTTDMTAAFVAAETALPTGSDGGGGVFDIKRPVTYLVTSWTPIRTGIVVEGAGQNLTIIKGSGAGACTVCFNGLARSHWKDLTIDGGDIKTAAMLMLGSSGVNVFESVRWKGGTTNSIVIGRPAPLDDDIADNTWTGCTIQSDNATGAQVKYRGNNVASNIIVGGRISTGNGNTASTVALDMADGSNIRFYGVELLGASAAGTYVVTKSGGVLGMIGGHVEGNGFLHTLSTDALTDVSAQSDLIEGVNFATSGSDAIYHEAPRTMIVTGGRSGGNIRIGTTARLIGKGNNFASGNSYVIEGDGELVANDAAKGSDVLAENNKLADTFLSSIASAPTKISALWLFDEDGATATITDRGTLGHNLTLSANANRLTPKNRGLAPSLQFVNASNQVEISAASNASPVSLTSVNHGLASGAIITISGGTGSWAGINGARTITVTGADTFTIPVDSSAFGALSGTTTYTRQDYFSTPDSDDFSFGNGSSDTAFTFIALVQPTATTSNVFFGKYNSTTGTGEYLFQLDGSSKLSLFLSDQSAMASIGRTYNTALTADAGTVHVYIATYSGSSASSGIKIYRDGVRVDDTNNNSGSYVAMENTTDVPGDFTFVPGRQVGNARMYAAVIVKEEWTAAQVLRATKLLQAHAAK